MEKDIIAEYPTNFNPVNFRTNFHTPFYSVKKPTDILFITSEEEVYIYSKDPKFVRRVKFIIDKYNVFYNKGIVLIPVK